MTLNIDNADRAVTTPSSQILFVILLDAVHLLPAVASKLRQVIFF